MTRRKYIVGVTISTFVLIFNQIFIQYQLGKKHQDAEVINLAGRQRMLSQKINLEFYKLIGENNNQDSIISYYTQWKNIHHSLLNGNDTLQLAPIKEKKARAILNSLTSNIDFITSNLPLLTSPNQINIQKIDSNQYHFLIGMDKAVKLLENEAEAKLRFIVFAEGILALIAILVISLEVKYIYAPITRQLKSKIHQLSNSENKLRAILDSSLISTVLISSDFKILSINELAKNSIKTLFQKEAKEGQDFWQFVSQGTEKEFENNFQKALAGEIVLLEKEITFVNQTRIWISFSFTPVYDEKRQIVGVAFNAMNIDKRKKAEEALRQSDNKLRAILDSSMSNSTLVGLDFKILSVNKKAKETMKLFFYKEAKEGDDFEQYIFKENLREFKSDFQKALTGESVYKEKAIRLKNTNKYIWFEFYRTPVYDECGKIIGVAFNSIEIQKRKELEENIKALDSKLRAMIDSSPNCKLLISPDFKIIHFNRIAKELTNKILKQDIFEGADIRDFIPDVSKENFYHYFWEALQGKSNIIEIRRTVNHLDICIQAQYFPAYHNKELIGVSLTIIDLGLLRKTEMELARTNEMLERTNTVIKATEHRLELLTSHFPDGSVSLISKDLVFLYTAGRGYNDFPINPKDLVGKPIRSILLPDIYAKIEEILEHIFDEHPISFEVQYEQRIYLNTLQPIFEQEKVMSSFVLVCIDITERKQNEAKIKEKNATLEKIAWVQSHEVRRPVANILGLMNLIRNEDNEAEVKIYLDYLYKATQELDQIVHKIVGYANEIY